MVVCVLGLEVGREGGGVAVFGAYALACDIGGTEFLLEAGAGWGTGDLALWLWWLAFIVRWRILMEEGGYVPCCLALWSRGP